MKHAIIASLLIFPILSIAQSRDVIDVEAGPVDGIWQSSNIYIVKGDIYIRYDDTLEIQPGTQIKFLGDKQLDVFGVLEAVGNPSEKIEFIATSEQAPWDGITFIPAKNLKLNSLAARKSTVQNCIIKDVSSNADAALNINNTFADITECHFENIQTYGISIQPLCLNSDLKILDNTFINLDDYCIIVYQNGSLDNIKISGNAFLANGLATVIQSTHLTELELDNNSFVGTDSIAELVADEDYIRVKHNNFLEKASIHDNNFRQIAGVSDENPHIIFFEDNEVLNELRIESNQLTKTGRFIYVDESEHIYSQYNRIENSSSLALGYLFNVKANHITVTQDTVRLVIVDDFGTDAAVYTLSLAGGDLRITDCLFEDNYGSCFLLQEFVGVNLIRMQNNDIYSCEYDKGGTAIRINGNDDYNEISSFQLYDNFFDDVHTSNNGGTIRIDLLNHLGDLTSHNNSYKSSAEVAGGSIYIDSESIGSISFAADHVVSTSVSSRESDNGKGGFLYCLADSLSDSFTVDDFTCNTAHSISDGGIFFLSVENDDIIPEISLNKLEVDQVIAEQGQGGILYLQTAALVQDLNLTNNLCIGTEESYAVSGAGFYLDVSGGITNVQMNNNEFANYGVDSVGGVFVVKSENVISQVQIKNNKVINEVVDATPLKGGALYIQAASIENLIMQDNDLSGLYASLDGGAFFIKVQNQLNEFSFTNNNFSNCSSGNHGGAVYLDANDVVTENILVGDNDFSNNNALYGGGSLFFRFNGSDFLQGINFSQNNFQNSSAPQGPGGALYLECGNIEQEFNWEDNTFSMNIAGGDGGAACLKTTSVNSLLIKGNENSEFVNCKSLMGSGGSIYLDASSGGIGYLDIDQIEIESETSELNAAGSGGGIYISSNGDMFGQLSIKNSSFSNLSSTGQGGGIYINMNGNNLRGGLLIEENDFLSCTANDDESNGGGAYISAGTVSDSLMIENNRVEACLAGASGGGLYVQSVHMNELIVENNSGEKGFINCIAEQGSGGALYVKVYDGGLNTLNLDNNKVDGQGSASNAGEYGGGFFISVNGDIENQFIFSNNVLSDLQSEGSGGGLYLDLNSNGLNSGLKLTGSQFENCQSNSSEANGGGVYLSAGDIGGVFQTESVSFSDCLAGNSGGGIYVSSNSIQGVDFSTSTLNNCHAVNGSGGAVYINNFESIGAETMIEECTFTNCTSAGESGNGGALSLTSEQLNGGLQIKSSLFEECVSGNNGGALYFSAGSAENISFLNNNLDNGYYDCRAIDGSGGAVYFEVSGEISGTVELSDNSFLGSQNINSGDKGGAVYFAFNHGLEESLILKDNEFGNLSSHSNGGAVSIFVPEERGIGKIEVEECNFESCSVELGQGGAIDVNAGYIESLSVINSSFGYCSVEDGNGGALSITIPAGFALSQFDIANSEFSYCTLQGGNGGAVNIVSGNVDLALVNNTVFSNCGVVDGNGGAMAITSSILDFDFLDNDVEKCASIGGNGGSIYLNDANENDPDSVSILRSSFYGNSGASENGGAIYISNVSYLGLSECSFRRHTANANGGALFIIGCDKLVITSDSLLNNVSGASGGAIWLNGGHVRSEIGLSRLEMFGNSADISGGALCLSFTGQVSMENSRLYQNVAGSSSGDLHAGGALYLSDANELILNKNYFFDNSSTKGSLLTSSASGGALFLDQCSNCELTDNYFLLNTAVNFGGALYHKSGEKFRVKANRFIQNDALNGGAAFLDNVDFSNDSTVFIENDFLKNFMGYCGGGLYINRDDVFLFRNRFVGNENRSEESEVKGSSVYISDGAENIKFFNNIFHLNKDDDQNDFDNATVYLDAFQGSPSINNRLYIENNTFLNNSPNSAHVLFSKNILDSVKIFNSVFQGNVNLNDSLFNTGTILTYNSRLEGDLFGIEHVNPLFSFYQSMEDSYILAEASPLIDKGFNSGTYNDAFRLPGRGEERNDPGASGGRFNSDPYDYLDRLSDYLYNSYLVIERLSCDNYTVRINNDGLPAGFDQFTWYIGDQIYHSDTNHLAFEFDNNIDISLLGVAYSNSTDEYVAAGDSLYNLEILYDGLEVSLDATGVKYTLDDTTVSINYPAYCLDDLNLSVQMKDLLLRTEENYEFDWSIEASEFIVNSNIEPIDKESAAVSFEIDKDGAIATNHIEIYYHGYYEFDGEICNNQCHDTLIVYLQPEGFEELQVDTFYPENGSSVYFIELDSIELFFNQLAGYNNGGVYEDLPLNTNIVDWELFDLYEDGNLVSLDSVIVNVVSGKTQFLIYPSEVKSDVTYSVEVSDLLVTKCFWNPQPLNYQFNTIGAGLNELGYRQFRIIPNPVYDVVNVIFDELFSGRVVLFGTDGAIIVAEEVDRVNQFKINVEHLASGVYYLRLWNDRYSWSEKIIKE